MNKILVTGEPGTGKTYSIHTLPPEQTLLLKGAEKLPVPKKGYRKLYTKFSMNGSKEVKKSTGNTIRINKPYNSSGSSFIKSASIVARERGFKYIVVDDFNYIMLDAISYFKANNKGDGRQAYQKIIQFAEDFFNDINLLSADGIYVVIIWQKYPDKNQLVMPGQYYNEVIVPHGKFDVTLECYIDPATNKNSFKTNGVGMSRSPEGMFDDIEEHEDDSMPNDIMKVIQAMKVY